MISISGLQVKYDKEAVLDELDLNIAPNLIHGLVGFNGSGKTTLLNAIYGNTKANKGGISFNGQPVSRKNIAYLEAQNFFYHNIKAGEYLSLFPSQNKSFDLNIWKELLQLPMDEFVENYSTGMKKKLALLGILKLDKPILILDEPFNGVDMETSRIIRLLLLGLKSKNKTIIVTSHILETLTNMCDFIHHLQNGKISKSYGKTDLEKVDHEIFNNMEERTIALINKVI